MGVFAATCSRNTEVLKLMMCFFTRESCPARSLLWAGLARHGPPTASAKPILTFPKNRKDAEHWPRKMAYTMHNLYASFEMCQGLRAVFPKPFLATCVFTFDRGLRILLNRAVVEDLVCAFHYRAVPEDDRSKHNAPFPLGHISVT